MVLESLFHEWSRLLGKRDRKKMAGNTYLERHHDSIRLRLHATYIIRALPCGKVHYDSGGWRTVTTKRRLTQFGPVAVWQRKGEWFAGGKDFADGMEVTGDLPEAPTFDVRPNDALPEDYHA